MPYNFDLSITARVSAKTVEEIVKTVIQEQTGRKIESIEAKTARVSKGMGPDVTATPEFDGYQVNFVAEKTTEKAKSTKPEFKEDNYE